MWVANAEQQVGAIGEVLARAKITDEPAELRRALLRIGEILAPPRIVLAEGCSPEALTEVMRRHAEEPVMIVAPEPPALSPPEQRAASLAWIDGELARLQRELARIGERRVELLVRRWDLVDGDEDVAGSGQTEGGS